MARPSCGAHPRPVGVEDPDDAGVEPLLAVVGHRQRLGVALRLVVDAARADRVDVAPVLLGLGMDLRVAVDLRGRGEQEARALELRHPEHVVGAVRADLQRVQRQPLVVDRARRRGQVVDEVDRLVDLDELGDVEVEEDEVVRRGCARCSARFPVSRLSTQMTRWPLPSRVSQRWEPRKPAPPVTTQVLIDGREHTRGPRRIPQFAPRTGTFGDEPCELWHQFSMKRRGGVAVVKGVTSGGETKVSPEARRRAATRPDREPRRGLPPDRPPVLDLRGRRRGRLPAGARDPAHQGASDRRRQPRPLDADGDQARGARRPPPARAPALGAAPAGGEEDRDPLDAIAVRGPRARRARRQQGAGGAKRRGPSGPEAAGGPRADPEGRGLLLRRDRRDHRLDPHEDQPLHGRGQEALPRGLRRAGAGRPLRRDGRRRCRRSPTASATSSAPTPSTCTSGAAAPAGRSSARSAPSPTGCWSCCRSARGRCLDPRPGLRSGSASASSRRPRRSRSSATRSPPAGRATAAVSQIAASGGTRGAGMAAIGKALAICGATAAGGAACVAGGVVTPPVIGGGAEEKPAIEAEQRPAAEPIDQAEVVAAPVAAEPVAAGAGRGGARARAGTDPRRAEEPAVQLRAGGARSAPAPAPSSSEFGGASSGGQRRRFRGRRLRRRRVRHRVSRSRGRGGCATRPAGARPSRSAS